METKKYKLGDMWSSDFDYDGMLRKGARVTVKTNLTSLNKLFDSFEDVNYHTCGGNLWSAIQHLKEKEFEHAENFMNDFNQACRKEMKDQGIKF